MSNQEFKSISLSNPNPASLDTIQKVSAGVGAMGLLIFFVAIFGIKLENSILWLSISLICIVVGILMYAQRTYAGTIPGIKNNGIYFNSITNRGLWAWMAGILITGFYVLLYWFPHLLGHQAEGGNVGLVALFDPLSLAIKKQAASQWFVYGTLYTLAILLFGVKFIWKYRQNKYQILRTVSVMFFQLVFAFLLPEIMERLNQPSMDLKYLWPLNYYFFFDWNLDNLLQGGNFGIFLFIWGIALFLIISPILTYLYGKRWYCSWVCGCGGLAETAGDPFRHLSNKKLNAWRLERWFIHAILVFIIIVTLMVIYTYITKQSQILFLNTYQVREWYGFFIGAAFSGVIGVGFYPILGNRVWCRFGCPAAAILGLQQKFFSRFRITTNGGQCISCGNCSNFCEMGIDVRWYAQRGQNIVRSSCVGCGICAAVCPRGVLRLENGSVDLHQKTTQLRTVHIREDEIGVL